MNKRRNIVSVKFSDCRLTHSALQKMAFFCKLKNQNYVYLAKNAVIPMIFNF